jgi:signal transduction histidine kinase
MAVGLPWPGALGLALGQAVTAHLGLGALALVERRTAPGRLHESVALLGIASACAVIALGSAALGLLLAAAFRGGLGPDRHQLAPRLLAALTVGTVLLAGALARGRRARPVTLLRPPVRLLRRTTEFAPGELDIEHERDRDERKRAEAALHAAVRARDEFLYIAGHELRTPLCTVVLELGSLERLCRKSGLDERVINRVTKILRQTDRLTQLMHRLLEVSRLSSTSLDLHCERVDLAEVARDVLERFSESALRAGSTLELNAPGAAVGSWDKVRLEQLLTNLVGNAIKYGAGKPIVVSIDNRPDGSALRVRDQGIGVAPEDVNRIFEAFERGVSVEHFAGFGLGLFISRRIVEAHGGTIKVESTLGQGATFVVALPPAARGLSTVPRTPTHAPELRIGARG